MTATNTNDTRWYVTSALPYVNAAPHVGHALELVLTDAIVRYRRLTGHDVRASTGTDDNSLKNVRAAETAGRRVADHVADNAAAFRRLAVSLGVQFDDFVSTSSDARHAPAVAELWYRAAERGDIYRRPYRGLYCVGCEHFLAPPELIDGRCPEHGVEPELVEEENYFFRLSRYQGAIERAIASGAVCITPSERRNEVLRFVESGLEDFSISRSAERARGWGIPVPGDPTQVVFVWFDALASYVAALGWPADAESLHDRYWRRSARRAHVIGKGIVRFHAVYWPAILLSAGIELPTDVLCHGYITAEGQKIGKSAHNAIDPFDLCERYGSDALRYFLLRGLHTTKDGDFSARRLVALYDAELADQLGNLVRRSLRLVERFASGRVPEPEAATGAEDRLRAEAESSGEAVEKAFDDFAVHEAAAAAWRFVAAANRYVDETAPWSVAKHGDESRLRTILAHLAAAVRLAGASSAPFVPDASTRILEQVGCAGVTEPSWAFVEPGTRVELAGVLFPKYER